MVDSAKFWNKTADRYARSPIGNMESYEKTLERTRAHLSLDDVALEIGCGTGTTALLLAPSVNQFVASDSALRMIEIAREKGAAEVIGNVRFDHATIFDEKLEPGTFDAVLAFNLLHLLEDAPATLRRANQLLKPGGVFISKTVCLAEKSRFFGLPIAVMRLLGLAPYVTVLSIAELEGQISTAGFDIVEKCTFPASLPSRFVVARKRSLSPSE